MEPNERACDGVSADDEDDDDVQVNNFKVILWLKNVYQNRCNLVKYNFYCRFKQLLILESLKKINFSWHSQLE